jgi:hypothetical protein
MSDKDVFRTEENYRVDQRIAREKEKHEKQLFRTQMLEERRRSTLYRKLMRTAGITVSGFAAVSAGKFALKKLFGKLAEYSQHATTVLNKSFVTRETTQNTQAMSAWLNDKGLDEKSAYATLDRYAQVSGIKDMPYTKIMERFLKEAQKATPKQLQSALGHGADPEFLRKIKDYSGNFSEELKAFKGDVISDEDLKKMERLNVSWGRFLNAASKIGSPYYAKLTKEASDGLDTLTDVMTGKTKIDFVGTRYPMFSKRKKEQEEAVKRFNERYSYAPFSDTPMSADSPKEAETSSRFSTPLSERLAAAREELNAPASGNKRIVQNFTFNIRSTDPEKASQEVSKRFKESLMNKLFMPEATVS